MTPLRFRPTLASFVGAAAYSAIPAAMVGLGTFLLWEKRGIGLLVARRRIVRHRVRVIVEASKPSI